MLVVTQGKVVIDHIIYETGEIIDCLSSEEEACMVAEGIAERFEGDSECFDPEGGQNDEKETKPLTAAELKARCKELGLPTNGKKDELKARIEEFEAANAADYEAIEDEGLEGEEPPVLTAEVPR